MRTDMHKVICEEPRHGSGRDRQSRRANIPLEDRPKFEGMMRPHVNRKWFGEHLGPLRRWLRSQVGRPWNDVYSEACKVIKPDSVVRNHIKFHLLEMVERNTFMHHGKVYVKGRWWRQDGIIPVSDLRGASFSYVHPETGILLAMPTQPRSRWRDKDAERRALTQRRLSDGVRLIKLDGIWYVCRLDQFPAEFKSHDSPVRFDLAQHRLIGPGHGYKFYGEEAYCAAKRQLSRRELRRFGLSNSPAPSPVLPSSPRLCEDALTMAWPRKAQGGSLSPNFYPSSGIRSKTCNNQPGEAT